jgi:hypothetical protein
VAKYEPQPPTIYHYTNKRGYNAIKATPEWCFKAFQPLALGHPFGAYFTMLGPETPNLAKRIRVPREKIEFTFSFLDQNDLTPLRGGRGTHICFSPADYTVAQDRQLYHGEREFVL